MRIGIIAVKGGPGSGNWGHVGRPGLVGGSGGGAGGITFLKHSGAVTTIRQLRDFASTSDNIPESIDGVPVYTHAVRHPTDIDAILESGIDPGASSVYTSKGLVRDRGSGFVLISDSQGEAIEGVDVVERGLSYPEFKFESRVPPDRIVRVVREVPYGIGGHTIREDELAAYALRNQGLKDSDVLALPRQYQEWFDLASSGKGIK